MEDSREKIEWIDYLYFAYKKAKHFVTRETSFVNSSEIISFEKNIECNIKNLDDILNDEKKLRKEVKDLKGYLYFIQSLSILTKNLESARKLLSRLNTKCCGLH